MRHHLMAGALAGAVLFTTGGLGAAEAWEKSTDPRRPADLFRRDSLTDNWFALGQTLEQRGVSVALGLTQVYQLNLEGGLATHRRAGRYSGSYDLEVEFDLERLFRLTGGTFFVLAEGSWSDGLDASSVGSLLGINDDAGGDRAIDVTETWYQQEWLGGRLIFRVGKIDLTGGFECRGCPASFDGSAYANDEVTQFLSSSLVNNPTIPFPDNGLGVMVHAEPVEGFYVTAGAADAQADARETGFRTAFHEEDHFFAAFEIGLAPALLGMPG
ncbi:MAG: carbohydrate porin, partial [Phycisphaerae bacterium]